MYFVIGICRGAIRRGDKACVLTHERFEILSLSQGMALWKSAVQLDINCYSRCWKLHLYTSANSFFFFFGCYYFVAQTVLIHLLQSKVGLSDDAVSTSYSLVSLRFMKVNQLDNHDAKKKKKH